MSDDLRVNINGNQSGFQAALQQARAAAKKFSHDFETEVGKDWTSTLKSFGASAVGFLGFETLKSHIEGLMRKGAELRELSEQFEMSTDSVQKWEKALDKGGVAFNTFARAIETLRQKRQAVGEDFKNLDPFRRVGISDQDVFHGSDESLLMKALQSNDRAAIADLLGPRAARLKSALPHLSAMQGQEMPFTSRDVEILHDQEVQIKEAQSTLQKFSLRFGTGRIWAESMRELGAIFRGDLKGAMVQANPAWKRGKAAGEVFGPPAPSDSAPEESINTAQAEAKLAKEQAEWAEKHAESEERILDAQRQNMTIADRRASIEKELFANRERLKQLDIYGPLTAQEEAERNKLSIRQEGLIHELRDRPLNFSADSLSKVGLYSASSIAFNPLAGIQQEQLSELRAIHNTLRTRPDPFE